MNWKTMFVLMILWTLKGWRDGLVVKGVDCSYRGLQFKSEFPCWVAQMDAKVGTFGRLCAPVPTCTHTYTRIIKSNKNKCLKNYEV